MSEHYLAKARSGPRVTGMRQTFASIASGASGRPATKVEPDWSLLSYDAVTRDVVDQYMLRSGTFNAHANASIPFSLEENCRMGAGLLRYQRLLDSPLHIRFVGTAESVMPRSIVHLSGGDIRTLSCSVNAENHEQFVATGAPDGAEFFVGPFYDLTDDVIAQVPAYKQFTDGFDVVYEHTTFQMYGPERQEPINLLKRQLRPGGLMVFVQKLQHANVEEYRRRERQKDDLFKSLYFDEQALEEKRVKILDAMERGQVTLDETCAALESEFEAAVVTWSSSNFVTMVASDDPGALQKFVACLSAPAVPADFVHEPLPRVLFGVDQPLSFI